MNDINRRFFSPEQKVAILREHLIEGKAVSDLCDKRHVHPTVFYQWQRQFFENGTAAFESKQSRSRVSDGYQKKIEALEQKLQRKNEVLSELLEEHTRLKKRTWGGLTAQWVAQDTRDAIMDFIGHWSERTEIGALQLVAWIGLSRSKFYFWRNRYGKANEH
jgi:transposase-like protein